MTEENRSPSSGPQSPKEPVGLADELRDMGQQLEAVFRAAIESDRTKQLQSDLAGGVREITAQVQTAVKSLQTNPRVQQAEERGRQVLTQAQRSKLAQEMQETVTTGITQLNEQLRKLVDRLEHERAEPVNTNPATQHVPVETETPPTTTGYDRPPSVNETTKLD